MAEFGMTFGAVAALQAVRLEGLEIRHGADFEPPLLRTAEDFKVESERTREADVTTLETDDAVRELQLLHQSLDVPDHLVK